MFLRLAKSKTVKRDEHAAVELIPASGKNRVLCEGGRCAWAEGAPSAVGRQAMTHLGSSLGQAALDALFDNNATAAIEVKLKNGSPAQLATLTEALANSRKSTAADLLINIFLDPAKPLAVRQTAVRGVAGTSPGRLVDLAAGGKFPEALKPTAGAALTKIMNVSVRNRAREHFPSPRSRARPSCHR